MEDVLEDGVLGVLEENDEVAEKSEETFENPDEAGLTGEDFDDAEEPGANSPKSAVGSEGNSKSGEELHA